MTECAPSKCIFDYPDILDTLFQYLHTSDLKMLRLTNKYFAESAKDAVLFECRVQVEGLDEFAESNVAKYFRQLRITQHGEYLFDMNDNPFWHKMPKLGELEFYCYEFHRGAVGELIVPYDLLAKLKRFSARVRVVQLPKILPSTLEHLELIDCEYVDNREVLSTCRYSLSLYDVRLQSLLALHSSLTHLNIYMSEIELSNLPPSLISLKYIAVRQYLLPEALPAGLQYLDCSSNDWSSLPHLPSGLKYLDCSYNRIESIENLPPSLEVLICHNNNLTSLPPLPQSLKMLSCSHNPLADYFSSSNLERLPPLLKALDVSNATMYKGFNPALPSGLLFFNCSCNNLLSLPLLPPSLEHLVCSDNALQSLPPLPTSLQILDCYDNNLTCLPTLPKSIRSIGANIKVSMPSLIPNINDLYVLKTYNWRGVENWKTIYTRI